MNKLMMQAGLLIVLLAGRPATAATWHVPADAPTIAAGLAAAASGDTVAVDCGTWFEHGLVITAGVTLRSASGDPACATIDGQGLDRVIDVAAGADTVTIAGLTITGGSLDNGFLEALGGGVRVMNGALRLADCVLTGNTAVIGGGLGAYGSWLDVSACVFAGNAAADSVWAGGGGAWCRDSAGRIVDAVFTGNTAFSQNPADPGDGGGLFMNNSRLQVDDGLFTLNSTGGGAGALYSVDTDSAHVRRCRFEDNTARWGGALFIENASAWIDSCTVAANTALAGGGGLSVGRSATPLITGTLFDGNVAVDQHGGAAESIGSRAVFRACTFTDNTAARWGGGVNATGLGITFEDCVFARNTAGLQGGVLRLYSATAVFRRCTLVGNAAPLGGALACQSFTNATLTNTIIAFSTQGEAVYAAAYVPIFPTCTDIHGNAGGDWTGTLAAQLGVSGNIDADPLFSDAAAGDYTLQWISPCAPASSGACGLMGALGVVNDLSGIPDVPDVVPTAGIALLPNYPNPFNPSTTLRFALEAPGRVRLTVFDAAGRQVRRLLDAPLGAGEHAVQWDGRDERGRVAPAGMYLYRVECAGMAATGRMVLLK